jgi:amphi-Trp domain-containing protein
MGKETVLFASEERQSLRYVADFLRQLADKLDQKQVVLRQGSQEVIVDIPDNVVLELKVEEEQKKKKLQRSLEIEIEWYEGDEAVSGVTLG